MKERRSEIALVAMILVGAAVFAWALFDTVAPDQELDLPASADSAIASRASDSAERPSEDRGAGRRRTKAGGAPSGERPSRTESPSRDGERTSVDLADARTGRPAVGDAAAAGVPDGPASRGRERSHARADGADPGYDPSTRIPARSPDEGVARSGAADEPARAPSGSSGAAGAPAPGSVAVLAGTQPVRPAAAETPPDDDDPFAPPIAGEDDGGTPPAPGRRPTNLDEDEEDDTQEPEPQTPVIVALDPMHAELPLGARFQVSVAIQNATDVGHVPFHLTFDPAVLRFDRGDEGTFLRSDGGSTAFFARPTTTPGTVVVGLSRLGRSAGVSGSGLLCTLHFEAIGSGATVLGFERQKVQSPALARLTAEFRQSAIVVD
jgi:hypothetical protein